EGFQTEQIQYLTQDKLQEYRTSALTNRNFGSYSKLKLRYRPTYNKDLAYNLLVNVNNGGTAGHINSQTDSLNQIATNATPHNFSIKQFFRYNTRPNYKHTSEIKAKYIYTKSHGLYDWMFDDPKFSKLIPVIYDEDAYNFLHRYETHSSTAKISYKHYWVINSYNHLYPTAGVSYTHQNYRNVDFQRLNNGQIHNFKEAGFNNDAVFQIIDPYIGVQYKFKTGNFIFRPGVIYHHYIWQVNQFDQRLVDETKGVFLPEFMGKYVFSNNEELELNYHLRANFRGVSSYANRFRLIQFNQVFRGNETLKNQLFHNASLKYHNFNMYNGVYFYGALSYHHRAKSVQNATVLEGVNQINSPVYTEFPSNRYGFNGSFSKAWKTFKLSFKTMLHLNSYSRIVDEKRRDYRSQFYHFNVSLKTKYDNLPNLEVGLKQNYSTS